MLPSIFAFARDIIKASYLFFMQVRTRLFWLEREFPSSISLSSRLDVIPRAPHHKRNKLVLKTKATIDKWSVVNTWHGSVVLEKGAVIGIGSIVLGPVKMGPSSRCSQNCFITGQSHRYDDISKDLIQQGFDTKEVVIEENTWIGSNCVILPGVRIGKNSVIGAGSVVTKDIPPFSVAVGNPAKIIKKYNAESGQWMRV